MAWSTKTLSILAKAISWPRNLKYTEARGWLEGRDLHWVSYGKEQTAHHYILHGACLSVCDPVHLVAYSLEDTPHLGDSVSILHIRVLQQSLLESLCPHSNLRRR